MTLCAGGCGREAVPGGKYHCRKGGDGYYACAMRKSRGGNTQPQREVNKLTVNRPQELDALAAQVAKLVIDALQPDTPSDEDGIGGGGDIQTQLKVLFDLVYKIDAKVDSIKSQPRPTYTPPPQTNIAPPRQFDDDLDDLLHEVELTEEQRIERGRQATENFLRSLQGIAATSRTSEPKGPRKLANAPTFGAPDESAFDDLFDKL